MISLKDTTYPDIKKELTNKELFECFTPTACDIEFCKKETRTNESFLCMVIILKSFQRYGYAVMLADLEKNIINYIIEKFEFNFSKKIIIEYDSSRNRRKHVDLIKKYLNIKSFSNGGERLIALTFYDLARSREDTADIINGVIETLIRERYEFPGFTTLLKECKRQKSKVYKEIFEKIFISLDDNDRERINAIFTYPSHNTRSNWNKIKFEIPNAKVKSIKKLEEHITSLSIWNNLVVKLENIPFNKLTQFAAEAYAADLREISEIEEKKRYTIALSLIKMQKSKSIDNLITIFQKEMAKIKAKADETLKKYLEKNQDKTDKIIKRFSKANDVCANQEIKDPEKISPIKNILASDADLVAYAKLHAKFGGKKSIRFMAKIFAKKKSIFFKILTVLKIHSTSQDDSIVKAIQFMIYHRSGRSKWIPTTNDKKPDIPSLKNVKWIHKRWWFLITGLKKRNFFPQEIKKEQFEVCLCEQVALELKCGDLYVEDSIEFSDWRKELVSWETCQATLSSFVQMVGLPVDKPGFIHHVKSILIQKAHEADTKYDPVNNFSIENGEPLLRRTPGKWKKKKNEDDDIVQEKLGEDIPLMQVLFDTAHWLDWPKVFGPLSGHDGKVKNELGRAAATVYIYGTGLGPREGASILNGFTARQLSWTNEKNVTAEKLDKAIAIIGNAYMKLQLPLEWGDGSRLGADGTHKELSKHAPFAELHLRYGEWGGIAYYHVADNYIAVFSKFIPCGVREAVHILDPLIKKLIEIKGNIIHGDTHAQSAAVYGLAFLLGIRLMPRIKNWKGLNFYKPSMDIKYKNIDKLFKDEEADWKTIEKYLHEMFQIAQSIMAGKITPSAILRRLGTHNKKNKIFQAFSALGRVIRTAYLLEYLTDMELRQVVHGTTVKCEQFNYFTQWIHFAKEYIKTVKHDEQVKVIKYNHLIAVALSFWNAWEMTEGIVEAKDAGLICGLLAKK